MEDLNLKLASRLIYFKNIRNFDTIKYINKKKRVINEFFSSNNLDSAVVGISGGIDSAVVISLLSEASKMPDSPIKRIVGLSMPIYGAGTTNQNSAESKAMEFLYDLETSDINKVLVGQLIDLTDSYNSYVNSLKDTTTNFAKGQLASIVRTPMLYYQAAVLQEQGFKSIVVGTTNRDEGSYIGFFGKASDAMVDLQPIADIHKSEVYKIAKKLNVHEDIINAIPSGDVHDGRVDEEMIGAPYWFLEFYLQLKQYCKSREQNIVSEIESLCIMLKDDKLEDLFLIYIKNIESIHDKNKHKYQVGSPAHFIDVMERKIHGGW
jgi:NAD+ synthetase